MNALTKDRAGPAGLEELSMAAVDRWFEDEAYRRNATLEQIYHELHAMTPAQREAMRGARRLADGGQTHRLGQMMRPRAHRLP